MTEPLEIDGRILHFKNLLADSVLNEHNLCKNCLHYNLKL